MTISVRSGVGLRLHIYRSVSTELGCLAVQQNSHLLRRAISVSLPCCNDSAILRHLSLAVDPLSGTKRNTTRETKLVSLRGPPWKTAGYARLGNEKSTTESLGNQCLDLRQAVPPGASMLTPRLLKIAQYLDPHDRKLTQDNSRNSITI